MGTHDTLNLALELLSRARGANNHRSPGYVAAKQGTLRATKDFDGLDIEEVSYNPVDQAKRHAILHHANGRVRRGNTLARCAHATNNEVASVGGGALFSEVYVRRGGANVHQIYCEHGLDLVA